MMEYYEHITQENDRWDLIAEAYYADATRFPEIIKANLNLLMRLPEEDLRVFCPAFPLLPAGVRVKVPVEDDETTVTQNLPPWR
ncbi:putative inner membrane protein [Chloroherpeton thalassium ATCC 35110]|uniref:Putative inner membrane protein n=1 Tax=Chloroherpeton thalassium (strain ATCC 35110 / GB-78) TaxID=517418 RepID=B3QTI9_CHLT3|nr:hypothetical protein [Chloroherpeton thalassium]ACF12735.1 putative inner membrane protein [Chloroherpeton thalassium ATCC 35110]